MVAGFSFYFSKGQKEDIKTRKFQWSVMKYSYSPHRFHAGVWQKHKQCCSSESRWGHSSSWLSMRLLWGCVRRVVGLISVWYEMLSRARAKWAEINSLRWSTITKQLSGLCWQNAFWRGPIGTGTGPKSEAPQSTRRLNSRTESSQLIYYTESKARCLLEEPRYAQVHTTRTGNLSQSYHYPPK